MALSRRKFLGFAAVAMLLSVLITLAGALAADFYLHHRAERSAGLNRWGYRGPVVGRKGPGEIRFVVLGGSTAFGYGGTWDEAIPALLEQQLNQGDASRRWRGINLGYNNEGAYSFAFTLRDFAYLDYDVVVLYEGYNDLGNGDNMAVFRHTSPVFKLTGYFPILPLVVTEKARAIRSGGNLGAYYAAAGDREAKTVFRPGIVARTSATALETTAQVADALARQLDRVAAGKPSPPPASNRAGCVPRWVHYCDSVDAAVQLALSSGKVVVVASQPALRHGLGAERHAEQHAALADMMARRYGGNARVRYADLSGAVDTSDTDLSFDGMHLGTDGNLIVAKALVAPVRSLAGGSLSTP